MPDERNQNKADYYREQLERKFCDDWTPKKIKVISNEGNESNWISLNDESLKALEDFIKMEKGKE